MKYLLFFITIFIFSGCQPSEEKMRSSLNVVLESDLNEILSGVQKEKLIPDPNYKIIKFKNTPEGKYSYLAEVDFYFLKDIKAKIVRKYRYDINFKKWDRFYNKYIFY